MKKETPILFSAPMVRALLDGTRTQTRRIVSPKHLPFIENMLEEYQAGTFFENRPFPYGKRGDSLWVRETWGVASIYDKVKPSELAPNGMKVSYFATDSHEGVKGRPSIFMPRWASRISLEITGVRVERLHDISEEDARAEGLYMWSDPPRVSQPCYGISRADVFETDPRKAYQRLWENINGKGSWDLNPWVWVLSFNVKKEGL
jgi:hypothetical protein